MRRREIYRYRPLYLTYPQIVEAVTPQFRINGKLLISKLSFSHIVELLNPENAAKRTFYELECIQGNWSVRELKRHADIIVLPDPVSTRISGMSIVALLYEIVTLVNGSPYLSNSCIRPPNA